MVGRGDRWDSDMGDRCGMAYVVRDVLYYVRSRHTT